MNGGEVKVEIIEETRNCCMENPADDTENSNTESKENKTPLCTSCGQPISERFILKIHDDHWHEDCLRCSICTMRLSENCFSKETKLYCRDDYRRLYGCKCSGCKNLISPNELVMKALQNVYHVDCFKCDECGDKLEKGDEFILKDDRLYCSADFNVAEQKSDIDVFSSDEIDSMSTTSPKSPKFDEKGLDVSTGCKRPRTILTSQQRADFKAAFELTPKPCRKVREQLSHDTGLSVRVVQVWFQNQRAKLKKIQKKAEEGGGTEKIKKTNGQGKVTKKKRPKSTSSTKSSESSTSPSDFNLPVSTAMTSQFTNMLDMSSSYTSPNMSHYYGNINARQDILNNNQPNLLNQQNAEFNLRTPYTYNRLQNSYLDAVNPVGVQPPYSNSFQLTSAVNELTTAPATTSHFQLMPHLMNSFI